MLYQYVKRYLKNTLEEAKIDFSWSPLDNIKFFNFVNRRYSNQEFAKEIAEVKEAFRDFFEPVGKIVFRYKEESGIKFKIFPYHVAPKDSKHLKNIINIIKTNRKYIQYPYQEQNDQIAILGKIRRAINLEVNDTQESVNKRELTKYAISKALELGEKDIVVALKRKYIVKIFQKNILLDIDKEVSAPIQREGIANRFNGYTKEEIEETYKELFIRSNSNIDYFIKSVIKKVSKEKLNFKVISNKYYEANALKILHETIAQELSHYVALEKDYLLGVTGYLMRKHFQSLHESMAIVLIECIYEKNENANDFLSYYNGNTILIDNKKYQIPSLETDKGEKWNSGTLIGICNLWMHTKKKKEEYEHKLVDTDMKLEELEKKLLYIKPEKETQEELIIFISHLEMLYSIIE